MAVFLLAMILLLVASMVYSSLALLFSFKLQYSCQREQDLRLKQSLGDRIQEYRGDILMN